MVEEHLDPWDEKVGGRIGGESHVDKGIIH